MWRVEVARKLFVIALSIGVSCSNSALSETPINRGKYLVNSILACGNCHTPKTPDGRPISEKDLSGGLSFTTPAFNAVAANITPDRETGIGTWSDNDIKTALTKGLRPPHARLPGVPLAAVMPVSFYKAIRPDDLDAIVAYLRSVKPVRNEVAGPDYKLTPMHQTYPDAEKDYSGDVLKDPVKRGAYLATIGHCMECHSTWKRGVSDYKVGFGKGGRQFGPWLVQGVQAGWKGSTARNITAHRTKGIGAWTDAEIKRAITQGVSRDGRKLGPPMAFAWYANLKDDDLNALVAWLRTVPPQE